MRLINIPAKTLSELFISTLLYEIPGKKRSNGGLSENLTFTVSYVIYTCNIIYLLIVIEWALSSDEMDISSHQQLFTERRSNNKPCQIPQQTQGKLFFCTEQAVSGETRGDLVFPWDYLRA